MGDIEKGKRKRIIVALRVVLALRNNCSNNKFISLDIYFIKFYLCFFYVCSYFKSLLVIGPFARSPALSPTLYKFIVLGSLSSHPRSFGLGLQIVTLQLAPSMRRACVRVRATVEDGRTRSTTSRIGGVTTW